MPVIANGVIGQSMWPMARDIKQAAVRNIGFIIDAAGISVGCDFINAST